MNVLFVCARNRWRSPTAASIFRGDPRMAVRSAGLSPSSPRRLTARDLQWADLVLVMEAEHRRRIVRLFRSTCDLPSIRCLDIPDDFAFMDGELIDLLRAATEAAYADHLRERA